MPTIKDLRLEAQISITQLAKLADVDRQTAEKADNGEAIRDYKASAIVAALARKLSRDIKMSDVEGLVVL